jgi:Spy/CpxP family protein refolding chaperone
MLRRVLGIGLAAGLAAAGIAVQAQTNPPAAAGEPAKAGSADVIGARLAALGTELGLTAEQKPPIKEILTRLHKSTGQVIDDAKARIKEANTSGSPEKTAVQATIRAKARTDIRALRKDAHDKIAEILTAEQKTKFAELRAKRENDAVRLD